MALGIQSSQVEGKVEEGQDMMERWRCETWDMEKEEGKEKNEKGEGGGG